MPSPRYTSADGRTAMARASDARPPRYYDPARGRGEPAAVTAARERHRALSAEIERRVRALDEAEPDIGPGYEWYRELADEPGGAP